MYVVGIIGAIGLVVRTIMEKMKEKARKKEVLDEYADGKEKIDTGNDADLLDGFSNFLCDKSGKK